jgi:hypothetical protein
MVYGWLIPEGSGGPLRFLGVGTFSKRCLNNVLSHPVCIAFDTCQDVQPSSFKKVICTYEPSSIHDLRALGAVSCRDMFWLSQEIVVVGP